MNFSQWTWFIVLIANLYFFGETECIFNGDKVTKIDDYKYVVALIVKQKEKFGCTGAILNDDYVITAAHCVVDRYDGFKFSKEIKILAHTLKNRKNMGTIERQAKTVFVPEAYFSGAIDDIALIKVNRKFNFNSKNRKLQSVTLPQPGSTIPTNAQLIAAGYGDNEYKNGEARSDGKLRSLRVQIARQTECGNVKGGYKHLYMCVKVKDAINGKPQGIGEGDSGGALVNRKDNGDVEIVGVLSQSLYRQNIPNDMNAPGIYMKVTTYLTSFINKVKDDTVDRRTIRVHEMSTSTSCMKGLF